MRLENMRPGQIRDAVAQGASCLLPVGTLESEGDDVPLGADIAALQEDLLKLAEKQKAVIAPPIWYAPTGYIMSGPDEGTFDMPLRSFAGYLEEVLITLAELGFERIVVTLVHNAQGEESPIHKVCKFTTANLFNDLWKRPEIGRNWWIRPDRDAIKWNRYAISQLPRRQASDRSEKAAEDVDLPLRLEQMTPSELKEAVRRGLPCFVPSGVLENHGNHNPIGCDAVEAQDPVVLAAGKAAAVVAPTIWYGPTGYAVTGPQLGTTNVDGKVHRDYMAGVVAGLASMGFKNILFVQVHQGSGGPQWTAIEMGIQEYRAGLAGRYGPGWRKRLGTADTKHANVQVIGVPHGQYDHAGRNETSWMLYLRAQHTDLGLIRPGDYPFCWSEGGESERATAEWGREMTGKAVEGFVEIIKEKTQP
jgi:creatinine amidohydrolase/Fe(II)-dependent formamide hydrolase-like protein